MNHRTIQTNILKLNDLSRPRQSLPKSLIKAAGLLKGRKKIDPLVYQKQIRKEWERRFNKLIR